MCFPLTFCNASTIASALAPACAAGTPTHAIADTATADTTIDL
jgi:hypothetical protein